MTSQELRNSQLDATVFLIELSTCQDCRVHRRFGRDEFPTSRLIGYRIALTDGRSFMRCNQALILGKDALGRAP